MSMLSDTDSVLKLLKGASRILLLVVLPGSQCTTDRRGMSSMATGGTMRGMVSTVFIRGRGKDTSVVGSFAAADRSKDESGVSWYWKSD